MLSKMAYYLVERGHNTELFNPFKYPLQKLTKTYKLVAMNDLTDKNETMQGMIVAVASIMGGDKESLHLFEEHINRIKEEL